MPHEDLAAWAADLIRRLSADAQPGDLAVLRQQAVSLAATPSPGTATATPNPMIPSLVRDGQALSNLAARVAAAADVVIDLETTGLDHRAGVIVGIGIALEDATYYAPVNHCFDDGRLRPHQLPLAEVLAALRLQTKPLVAHNAKFEFKWLRHHGGVACHFSWDTLIVARLRRSDQPADLEVVAARELDVPAWGLDRAEMTKMKFLPVERVAAYCAKDVWYTRQIYRKQRGGLQ